MLRESDDMIYAVLLFKYCLIFALSFFLNTICRVVSLLIFFFLVFRYDILWGDTDCVE